jgi:hypothetical protein
MFKISYYILHFVHVHVTIFSLLNIFFLPQYQSWIQTKVNDDCNFN